ncbi:hypothetical protein VNO78_21121 [Psophocarpus tetragonolobus]|uniref:Late embryogenesis abundant protein LEA-2 subgroup domain-containing protein n=1 Tax=Psophocarpus tetragonolobus TaxID=3891 RepID=A0AAN9XHD7_PSOTE
MPMTKLILDLCYLFIAMLALVVILLAIDLYVLYMIIRPRFPSMHVSSATVSSLSITQNEELTATFDVTVVILNPNTNLSLSYNRLGMAVLFGPRTVATATVRAFSQQAGTETTVRTRFTVTRKLFPGGVVRAMAEQRARGSVDFGLTVETRVKFWWRGFFHTRARSFTFECFPVHVIFPSGVLHGGSGSIVTPSDFYLV